MSHTLWSRRDWSRRELVKNASLGALGVPLTLSGAGTALADGLATGPAVSFASARDQMETIIRLHGNLDAVAAPWWYTGCIYGMRPGEAPLKLVRFEGCEINLFTPQSDASYKQTGRTTSFFRDLDSGEFLERWTNPYTGRVVEVKSNVLGGNGHTIWSDAGVTPQFRLSAAGAPLPNARPAIESLPNAAAQALHATWTAFGPWIWMRHDRAYPPGLPQPLSESTSVMFERKYLPQRRSIPAFFSSTYMVGYPAWMDMKDQPGHAIWHADGLKLKSVDELPREYLQRIRRLHPQQLTVQG